MIQKTIYCIFLLFFIHFSTAQEQSEPVAIGKKYTLQSEVLQQERPILIALPDNYEKETKPYPVLYLLDGGGNFHHTTASVNFLAKNKKIPEMIVVGIPNTDDRTRDLTPPTETGKNNFPTAGGADNLRQFIEKELIPHIDQTYRTEAYKILVGHSFGGLFATHTLIHHPGIFNAYISISPSLWWDEQRLVLQQTDSFFKNQQELSGHLYMTMGNEGNAMLGGAWKFAALLEEKGPRNFHWAFNLMEEETHVSIPYRSTYKGLEFIFKDWNVSNRGDLIAAGGIDAILEYEEMLQSLYNLSPRWEERTLAGFGELLMEKGQAQKAIPIFKKCTELFPKSDKVWFQYGESLAKGGQKEAAIQNLEKAQELNPDNFQVLVALKQLGAEVLPTIQLTKKELEAYVGAYEIRANVSLIITSDGKQLWAEAPILEKEELFTRGAHQFFVISKNSTITFQLTDNKVTSISVETPDGTFEGKRMK